MIQLTILEKDNPKIAGWLMDNNIEYSSKTIIETGKNKPFITANVRDILYLYDSHEITHSRMVELLNEVAADYYGKQPVSVGYSEISGMLEEIINLTQHGIPVYAYGDNEAACSMSQILNEIYGRIIHILQSIAPAEQKDKGEEWEILKYSVGKGVQVYPEMFKGQDIHSVRRLSDNEVFTVGDEVKVVKDDEPTNWWGKITEFWIDGNGDMDICYNGHHYHIEYFEKQSNFCTCPTPDYNTGYISNVDN